MALLLIGSRFSTSVTGIYTGAVAPIDFNEVLPAGRIIAPLENLSFMEQPLSYGLQNRPELLTNLLGIVQTVEVGFILILVWAIGAFLHVAVNVQRYWLYRRALLQHSRICTSVQYPVNVIISKAASTPMMIGFIKPIIILPDMDFNDSELKMILSHELVHFERKDVWLKLVVFAARAVHWFNPAVHFLSRHINALCELSCDEKVVMEMGSQERMLYGETILFMLQYSNEQRNLVCASGLCNSKKNIKRRLLDMLNVKKMRKPMMALSLAVTLMITGIGGVVAYGVQATTPSRESLGAPVTAPSLDHRGNLVSETIGPDGVVVPRGFSWYRNTEFVNSLPTRRIDYPGSYGFELWETVTDYDPMLMFLREIMSSNLAEQLWDSSYFNSFSMEKIGFMSFFSSDQFISLLELFGESFVEDFLSMDVRENLAHLLGDNLEAFLNEAEALQSKSEEWASEQTVLVQREQELTNAGLQNSGQWRALTSDWEDIMRRTVELNNRTFALQNLFEQSVLTFMAEVM